MSDRVDDRVVNRILPTEDEVEQEIQRGSFLRRYFFRVSGHEAKLFSVLSLLFFMVTLVYSIIRDMKDALVITKLDAGSIPYMKMLVVLPGNIAAIFIIQKLLNKRSLSKVFSMVTLFFAVFFVSYGIGLLFDVQSVLEPSKFRSIDPFADRKMESMGLEWARAVYLVAMCYTTTIIYLFAELWGSCVLSFLFLTFTNSICSKKQTFRYTPLLLVFSNIALIISGVTMKWISSLKSKSSKEYSENIDSFVFILLGVMAVFIFLIHKVLEKPVLLKPVFSGNVESKKKSRVKIGFWKGVSEIFSSKLVLSMSFMVLAYSITVNMVEASFKSSMQISSDAHNQSKSATVLSKNGENQVLTGFFVVLMLLSGFSKLIHRFGWFCVASILPILSVISSLFYFFLVRRNVENGNTLESKDSPSFIYKLFFVDNDLDLEGRLGGYIVVAYKVLKYAAFDVCKEFISMTIDPTYRAYYKSIFDGVCGKLGKAMGSLITTIENYITNNNDVRNSALQSLVIVIVTDVLWLWAVIYLSRKYEKSIKTNKHIEDDKIRIFG